MVIVLQNAHISLCFLLGLVCDRITGNGFNLIPKAPHFITEPNDVVFDTSDEGNGNEEVTFRCLAGGSPYPTYQWFRQEYVIGRLVAKRVDPLANPRVTISDGTLHIYKPDPISDRGSYYCEASNRYGVIVSQVAQLNFGHMGHFNLKRSPEKGLEFWGKAIYCDPPQHYPAALYYWVRDSMPNFVEESERILVSMDGNLYFTSLELIDQGKYSCLIQSSISGIGRTGPFFHLNVQPHSSSQQLQFPMNFPKVFPEAPVAGETVYLECLAFGYPVPNYKWTRKGRSSQLPKNATLTKFNRVLVISGVTVKDSDDYVCTANNGQVSVSAAVSLFIQAKPEFTISLEDAQMPEGADLEWKCEAFGVPDVKYQWLKNGVVLEDVLDEEDSPRYIIRENLLLIYTLNPNRDQGVYQCKASNQIGSTFSSGEIRIVSTAPYFTNLPQDVELLAAERETVTFSCRPEGSPTPLISWKYNDEDVTPDRWRFIVDSEGLLEVRDVRKADEGTYTCVATNRYGSAESASQLKIIAALKFILEPSHTIAAQIDNNIELNCKAELVPNLELNYLWFVNGIRADSFAHQRFVPDLEPGTLLLYDVDFHDFGVVECRAITPIHAISTSTMLIIEGPPGPPGGLEAIPVSGRNVQLHWMDGAINGAPIISFEIEGRTTWNLNWTSLATGIVADEDSETERRQTVIDGNLLAPWSQHEFRVIASNKFGFGIPSSPSPLIATEKDKPYKYPDNIGGGGGNIGDLTITWTPLTPEERNAPGLFYRIFYKLAELSDWHYRIVNLNGIDYSNYKVVRVGDENFYKKYTVKVQAVNSVGEGPVSPEVVIYSAEARPFEVPTKVSAWPLNSTALNVSWLPVDTSRERIRGKLLGFRIKYWREGVDNPTYDATYHLSRSILNCATIVGLTPNTEYAVVAMTFNGAGSGAESEPFIMRTFKSAPLTPPTAVKVTPLSPSSISVTWRASAPSQEEAPLAGFKVRYWIASQDFSAYEDSFVPLGGDLMTVVSGLTPGVQYKLRVLAYSEGGDGRMSSPTWEFQLGDEDTLRGCAPIQWRLNQNLSIYLVCLYLVIQISNL